MSLSKIKILLLNVNRSGWHSGNMIYDMLSVQNACDTKIYGPGWDGYTTTDMSEIIKKLYGDDKPDFIYSYFTPNEKVGQIYIDHYKIPSNLQNFPTNFDQVKGIIKVFALSDFWARKPRQFSRDLVNSGFNYCFCCFTPPYSNPRDFYSFFDNDIQKQIKFFAHPRCVDKECFKDYQLDKKYDIITLGAMWRFYSYRVWMKDYLTKNDRDMGIRYQNFGHCGFNFGHNDFVREKYAMEINQSKMMASCGGRYHLAYNKIFESMGCNTLYIGEKPYGEEELHLKDGFNYVSVTKDNFRDKVIYYATCDNKRNEIIKNAYDTFLKYHTIEARSQDFVNLLESLS